MTTPPFSDEVLVAARAQAMDLDLPPACIAGVIVNTRLLQNYAALVRDFPLPDTCEPAGDYTP
ncbi:MULTISPECIES: DUF4089 domain-containing protein [Acetobacter]|jgi:hypothetical protein|uniref:DUF4089 domain-containing protein n=1 Tax=Acetobacter lovaniensis TaxID=104100 RepID=A0A841QDJ4_9PROT|nr:DUF4089 domain-containing protein [Acetobacter lovaniensis]MBB6456303.1 hypothetical protein [Acetobacter lovaniensis]MCI1698003.1 DUF4089 domain-containing protein [Acetobacter lovaniensis]MCI1796164.1 DUF4089 domain-containing protein [Acetobacter lovaniensis]MCP1239132.1 DUF4089 domain-containing protein [Acetobacter lovaniensis]NHN80678.1 DUF4089 domain-containing protein [Acetobacter lovaniensis]